MVYRMLQGNGGKSTIARGVLKHEFREVKIETKRRGFGAMLFFWSGYKPTPASRKKSGASLGKLSGDLLERQFWFGSRCVAPILSFVIPPYERLRQTNCGSQCSGRGT